MGTVTDMEAAGSVVMCNTTIETSGLWRVRGLGFISASRASSVTSRESHHLSKPQCFPF